MYHETKKISGVREVWEQQRKHLEALLKKAQELTPANPTVSSLQQQQPVFPSEIPIQQPMVAATKSTSNHLPVPMYRNSAPNDSVAAAGPPPPTTTTTMPRVMFPTKPGASPPPVPAGETPAATKSYSSSTPPTTTTTTKLPSQPSLVGSGTTYHAPVKELMSLTMNAVGEDSWLHNLGRDGGFWGDAEWYDLHLEHRMPLVKPMMEEMMLCLPPCGGKRVADLCAGSGRAAVSLLTHYPTAQVVLLDQDKRRLDIAMSRLKEAGHGGSVKAVPTDVLAHARAQRVLDSGPYDVIVAALAIRVMVERPAHYYPDQLRNSPQNTPLDERRRRYREILRFLLLSLRPGGHLVIGDHVRALRLFDQMKIMEEVGFVDVECSWRSRDFFVCGGRRRSIDGSATNQR